MIKIRTWKKSSKLDKDTNNIMESVVLSPLVHNDPDYIPQDNARQLARLFLDSLPGNTLDIFYGMIADEIIEALEYNVELDSQQIDHRIRYAIDKLAYGE